MEPIMIDEKTIPTVQAPSKAALAKATAIAVVIAAVLLFTIILPAEYGFDPLRTGAALGVTRLADATATTPPAPVGGQAVAAAANTPQSALYKVHGEDFTLRPGQGFELKYHMQKGT